MINSPDNALKKDEEVMVDESMLIYFAEVKCKIVLNRPQLAQPEKQTDVASMKAFAKRDQVMQMFED